MKHDQQSQSAEPVGIVISSGSAAPKSPRFTAYVWAPAPEVDNSVEVPAA